MLDLSPTVRCLLEVAYKIILVCWFKEIVLFSSLQAEKTDIDMTRKLLMIVCSRGDEAIRELVTALQSDYVRRPDLAKLILQ